MKQGRPSAVGPPSGEPAVVGAAVSAAVVSSEDVPVLIVCSLRRPERTNSGLAGPTGLPMKVKRAEWSRNGTGPGSKLWRGQETGGGRR